MATPLSPREIKAVVHNMAQPHHLQVTIHLSPCQAVQVLSVVSFFLSACVNLIIDPFGIENSRIYAAALDAGLDAMKVLCAALRSDADGRVRLLDASFLDITDAQAVTLAGAIASTPSCGLRRLDLDFNELSDEGAAALVYTLLVRAARQFPMVVSHCHQKELSDAGRTALIEAVRGANDIQLIL